MRYWHLSAGGLKKYRKLSDHQTPAIPERAPLTHSSCDATLISLPGQFKSHSDIDSCDSNSSHMTAR